MKYKQHARGKAPKHKLQRFSRFAHFTPAATEAAPFARHAVPLFFSSGSWNEAAETAALAIVQRPVSIFTMPSSASLKILRQILNGFLSLDFINRPLHRRLPARVPPFSAAEHACPGDMRSHAHTDGSSKRVFPPVPVSARLVPYASASFRRSPLGYSYGFRPPGPKCPGAEQQRDLPQNSCLRESYPNGNLRRHSVPGSVPPQPHPPRLPLPARPARSIVMGTHIAKTQLRS